MRRTGSRDPRESLEASVVSPFSIAVNTFSMRFGSRRNQRPPHQKHRSMTTVSAMIDTIRIGHITGPPLWNLSIQECDRTVAVQECLYRKIITGESSKSFHFFDPEDVPFTS